MANLIPYQCRHCGARFYFFDEYRRHIEPEVKCFWCDGHTCPDSDLCSICQKKEEANEALASSL